MADTTSTWDKVLDVVGLGASVYSQVSSHPIILPTSSVGGQYSAIAAQQQLQANYALNQKAPITAGLLANPTVFIIIAIAAVLLIILVIKR